MIEKTITYQTYSFKELSETVQSKLINETVNNIMEIADCFAQNHGVWKAIRKAEKNQVPWFAGEIYYHEYNGDKKVLKLLRQSRYLSDGTII